MKTRESAGSLAANSLEIVTRLCENVNQEVTQLESRKFNGNESKQPDVKL